MSRCLIAGIIIWGILILSVLAVCPLSRIHDVKISEAKYIHNIASHIITIVIILCSTIPMNLSPIWNGEISGHRNQYEKMADAFLSGHLYMSDELTRVCLKWIIRIAHRKEVN